jgi:AcrR family transcriptional regulator
MDAMDESTSPLPTRSRIRLEAEALYVLRGYEGFSFGDIAAAVDTTRANIHHHFGNKQRLMEELVDGFVTDAEARIAHHWTRPGFSLAERLAEQRNDLRRFYDRFNPNPGDRHVWSPLSRLRLDLPVLGDLAARALERVSRTYEASLDRAVREAVASGELAPDVAVNDIVQVLRVTLLSCGPLTQDRGGFDEVDQLLAALARLIGIVPEKTGKGRLTRDGASRRLTCR